MRGPVSILFMLVIAFAGTQCKRRPAEPAKPVAGFSMEYKEKVNPLDYFPLAVGTKWTYASTDKTGVNGSSKSVVTTKWTTEHVITAEYDIPAGKVFLGKFIIRDVQYDEPPDANETQLRWFRDHFRDHPPSSPAGLQAKNYLVAGNYVFDLDDQGWDAAAQRLAASYREMRSSAMPILFFPLDGVFGWSDRVTEERDYQVALLAMAGKGPPPDLGGYWIVHKREDVEVPYGKVRDAVYLIYPNVGGGEQVWFKEGLGFVKAVFIHSGSYAEWETTLVDFARNDDHRSARQGAPATNSASKPSLRK